MGNAPLGEGLKGTRHVCQLFIYMQCAVNERKNKYMTEAIQKEINQLSTSDLVVTNSKHKMSVTRY